MSCKVTCHICNKTFTVADKFRGRNAKCSCGNRLKIPAETNVPSASHLSATHDQSRKQKTSIKPGSDKPATTSNHQGLSDTKIHIDAQKLDKLNTGQNKLWFGIGLLFVIVLVSATIFVAIVYAHKPRIEALGYKSTKVLNESTHNVFGKFESAMGDMFFVVQVKVPIGPFIVSDIPRYHQDISKRWTDYTVTNHKQFTRKCTTIKEYIWNCPVNGQTEEKLPNIPKLSLQLFDGKKIAVIDPQCFSLEGNSDKYSGGCLIAFEDWSTLPDNTLWHYYMSMAGKTNTVWFNPELDKYQPLPWDEVITLYLPDTIDNRTRITLSIVFNISEHADPLSHYHSIRLNSPKKYQMHCQSQIPEEVIEWPEKFDRWNTPKAYGLNMLYRHNKANEQAGNETTTELIWNINRGKYINPTYGHGPTSSDVEVKSHGNLDGDSPVAGKVDMQFAIANARADARFWNKVAGKYKDIEVYGKIQEVFIPQKLKEFICSDSRNKPVVNKALINQKSIIGDRIYGYRRGKGAKNIELGHFENSVFGLILVWKSDDKIYGSTVFGRDAKDGDYELIFDNGSYRPVGQYMDVTDNSGNSMGVLLVIDRQIKTGKLGETVVGDELWTIDSRTQKLKNKVAEYVEHDGVQDWASVINDQGWLYFKAKGRRFVRRGLSSDEEQSPGPGPDIQVWDTIQKSVTHSDSTYTAYLQDDGTYAFEVNDEVYKYHARIGTSKRFGKWIQRGGVRMLFKYDHDGRLHITEVVNGVPQEGNRVFEYDEATNSIKQFIYKYDDQGVLQQMQATSFKEKTEIGAGYIFTKTDAEGKQYRVFIPDDKAKTQESLDVWLEFVGKSVKTNIGEDEEKKQTTYCEYLVSQLDGSKRIIRIAQDKSYSDTSNVLHSITQGAVRLAKNVQDSKIYYSVETDFLDKMKTRIIFDPSEGSLMAFVQRDTWRLNNQGKYEDVRGKGLWVPLNKGIATIDNRMVQLEKLSDECVLLQIGHFTSVTDPY